MTSREITPSPRMEMILSLAGSGRCLCDVGCDHGFITIAAILREKYLCAIDMDINRGPLESAKRNCEFYGVADNVDFRVSDGFEKLLPGEADCAVVAGMGGALIRRILTDGKEVSRKLDSLILSPQSEIPAFRRFLLDDGYRILDEDIVLDDGKYYFAMKAVFRDGVRDIGGQCAYPFGEAGITFGGLLLEKKHPVLLDFLKKRREGRNALLGKPGISGTRRAKELCAELDLINEAVRIYEG